MRRVIEGLYPVVPTPLAGGDLDAGGCTAITEYLAPHVHGLTLLGSMGEGPSLSVDERHRAAAAFAEACDGRLGIVFGVGANAVGDAIALARIGDQVGVDALFLPAPTYYQVADAGLMDFFRAVADATDVPIVLYDNPYITGFRLTPQFMAELAERAPTFAYVKVTDRTHGKVEAIRAACDLVPLSGSDDVMHHQVLAGARGALTGVPCVAPRASRRWWDACEAGDWETATRTFASEMSLVAIEMGSEGDEYPALTKESLRLLGVLDAVELRPPLRPVARSRAGDLARALRAAGEELADAPA